MDRRAFLTGLFGVAGTMALTGLATQSAQATPLGRAMEMPESFEAAAGSTPDGTPIEQAQARYHRRGPPPRRRYRRGPPPRRRRSRLICRNVRTPSGRLVRRCRRVY